MRGVEKRFLVVTGIALLALLLLAGGALLFSLRSMRERIGGEQAEAVALQALRSSKAVSNVIGEIRDLHCETAKIEAGAGEGAATLQLHCWVTGAQMTAAASLSLGRADGRSPLQLLAIEELRGPDGTKFPLTAE